MSRNVSKFGGKMVVGQTRSKRISGLFGKPTSPAGRAISAWTQQAENLKLRLRTLYLAGNEKAGNVLPMAERRLLRRRMLALEILGCEARVKATKILAVYEALTSSSAEAEG